MNRFTAFGQYFGYPKCCTEWFFQSRVLKVITYDLTDAQQLVHQGNGFIPCPSCARKVLRKDLEVEELISDERICPTPYPDHDCTQSLKWIDKQENLKEYEHIRIR